MIKKLLDSWGDKEQSQKKKLKKIKFESDGESK